jgi:catechol 2,3-dioxygenase-like lactoylglutathione lyase family enzyme
MAQSSNMPEISGLDHFAINVKSMSASVDWYHNVLGFRTLHTWSGVTMVGIGSIKVGIFEMPQAMPIDNPDNRLVITHVAFLLDGDKFRPALEALKKKGIAVENEEDTGIAYSFFIHDPDGNLLEFTSYHEAKAP